MSSSSSELPTSRLPDLPDERYPNLPSASTAASSSGSSSSLSSPPLARDVPTTYLGSISAWWAHQDEEIQVAEERLLRRMPSFIPDAATPDPLPTLANPDPLIARLQNFPLAPSPSTSSRLSFFSSPKPRERYLHGLAMYTPKTANRSRHVNVLLHGYGAALGFFAFGNLQAFGEESARTGRRAYALDWLGMGLSSRPSPKYFDLPPPAKTSNLTSEQLEEATALRIKERVTNAENFFVDSLEEWRKSVGAETMSLTGHSLGGYLSIAYTLKYPERVDKLILVSPAGIPTDTTNAALPKRTKRSDFTNSTNKEVQDVADAAQQELGHGRLEAKSGESQGKAGGEKKSDEQKTPPSRLRQVLGWAWEKNFSPFGVLRALGPLAPKVVGLYSTRRFEGLSELDVRDMHQYIYSISTAKGSGEYCITHLLGNGAKARLPMASRMDNIKVPVSFMYGDHDWMDIKGGLEVQEALKRAGNNQVNVHKVDNSGHNVMIDNPPGFNELLKTELSTLPASD